MKNISNKDIFKVPENYFDSLPDQIFERRANQKSKMFYFRSMAAAAVVILGVVFFVFKQELNTNDYLQERMTADINLYINAGYWGAEEVLSLADDPNLILDQIINEEWGNYKINEIDFEEDIWQ